MSIKISFTYYMKQTRVMLPIICEEFELVVFFAIFSFYYQCHLLKVQLQQKSGPSKNLGPPVFTLLEITKVKIRLSLPVMNDIIPFDQNDSYNLRPGLTVTRRNMRTNKFGFETVSTTGSVNSKKFQKIPSNLKNRASLNVFKFFKFKGEPPKKTAHVKYAENL